MKVYNKKKRSDKNKTFSDPSVSVLQETRQRSLFSLVLSACFVLLVCSTSYGEKVLDQTSRLGLQDRTRATVIIEQQLRWNATIYSISSKDCTDQWIARNSEIGVIKYWSQCTLSLARAAPAAGKICTRNFSAKRRTRRHFGPCSGAGFSQITKTVPAELSLRLALAAHKSPGWDVKRGKPKNGDINGFVKDLANRENDLSGTEGAV